MGEYEEGEKLTPYEEEELAEALGAGYPMRQEKNNIFEFFSKIMKTRDTTKVSNLDEFELGSIRILQSAELYADQMGLDKVGNYLDKEAEIVLASANSKKGFLINAAITQKRQLQSEQKASQGGNKGWFAKKRKEG